MAERIERTARRTTPKAPDKSMAASPKKAFRIPVQLKDFQAVHVNTVVYASESKIAQLARQQYYGSDKLTAYLKALRTIKWDDKVAPFTDMKKDGLEFGRFYVKFSPSPEAKPVFLIFLAEKSLREALKPGQEQVINIVHRGKMKPVVFDCYKTSRHDLEDSYDEEVSPFRIVITAESVSIQYRSERPGRHHIYVGDGFQIEVGFPNETPTRAKEDE